MTRCVGRWRGSSLLTPTALLSTAKFCHPGSERLASTRCLAQRTRWPGAPWRQNGSRRLPLMGYCVGALPWDDLTRVTEERVPAHHPLHKIQAVVDAALRDHPSRPCPGGAERHQQKRRARLARADVAERDARLRHRPRRSRRSLAARRGARAMPGPDEAQAISEVPFGWGKTVGQTRETMLRGLARVRAQFTLTMTAYNLAK